LQHERLTPPPTVCHTGVMTTTQIGTNTPHSQTSQDRPIRENTSESEVPDDATRFLAPNIVAVQAQFPGSLFMDTCKGPADWPAHCAGADESKRR
jgi:hypothetical protein